MDLHTLQHKIIQAYLVVAHLIVHQIFLHQIEVYLLAVIVINLKANRKSVVDYLDKIHPKGQLQEDLFLEEASHKSL